LVGTLEEGRLEVGPALALEVGGPETPLVLLVVLSVKRASKKVVPVH
jgi:hypothetical protein